MRFSLQGPVRNCVSLPVGARSFPTVRRFATAHPQSEGTLEVDQKCNPIPDRHSVISSAQHAPKLFHDGVPHCRSTVYRFRFLPYQLSSSYESHSFPLFNRAIKLKQQGTRKLGSL